LSDGVPLQLAHAGQTHRLGGRLEPPLPGADLIVMPQTHSEDDLVYYLSEGVTDYLPRPLTARGLSARLEALHQRRNGREQPVITLSSAT